MVQAYFNSELKWGRYDRMKQGCAKCMATQWCQLWAEIAASSSRFLEANHFEAQEVRNLMLQTDHNLELKRGRYDWLKKCCAKSMLLRDCYGPNSFWLFGLNFRPLVGLNFFVTIGPFEFSIFTNPIIWILSKL